MEQRDFDGLISAFEDWELSRSLAKGASIFPSEIQRAVSAFFAAEIQPSEYLPEGMDYFLLPNSPRIIMRPSYWERLRAFIDDFAAATDLQTVA